jgi:Fe-S cluster assembly ATPase SufC
MSDNIKLPEVMVFAGPNGSGKSTISRKERISIIIGQTSIGIMKKYLLLQVSMSMKTK